MRVAVAIVALALQLDTAAARQRAIPHPPPCVPTEHMPIAGFGSRVNGHMPVLRTDSALHATMPVLQLQACYLADSLGVRR